MHWIAPSEKATASTPLEKRVWNAADQFRADPSFNVNSMDTAMRVNARRHPETAPQDLPERQDNERLKDMVGSNRRFAFGARRAPTTPSLRGTNAHEEAAFQTRAQSCKT